MPSGRVRRTRLPAGVRKMRNDTPVAPVDVALPTASSVPFGNVPAGLVVLTGLGARTWIAHAVNVASDTLHLVLVAPAASNWSGSRSKEIPRTETRSLALAASGITDE